MKTSAIKNIFNNIQALLNDDISKIRKIDYPQLMKSEFGPNYYDRIMAVRGKLRPAFVEMVLNNASSRTSGNLGQLYELMYYIRQDARIGGMIKKRNDSATRINWNVTSGNKDNTQANEAANFLSKYYNDIKFKSLIRLAMDGRWYGFTAFQNIIIDAGSHYIFKDPAKNQISQSRWFQETSSGDKFGNIYLKDNNGKKRFINDINDVNFYRTSSFVNEHKNGYYDLTGEMARIIRLQVLKVWTIVFLSQLVERYGKPFIYSNLDDDHFKDPVFKADVERILANFGAERYGVFPDGFKIESLTAGESSSASIHLDVINFVNTENAISILGQNLTSEVKGGSFAAASTHYDVEEHLTEGDIEWFSEELQDDFQYKLISMNYPDLDLEDYPILNIDLIKNVDVEKIARGYDALSKLIDVPVEEIRQKAQSRQPRLKDKADPSSNGLDKYDEEVIGPSSRSASSTINSFLNTIGS